MADGVITEEGLTVTLAPTPLQQFNEARKYTGKRVAICTPTLTKPHPAYFEAVKAEIPHLEAAGWEHGITWMVGCAYISAARSIMARRALDWRADVLFFLDHDMSWTPGHLTKVLETDADVVGGTYRFKQDEVEYMGRLWPGDSTKVLRMDDRVAAIKAVCLPAGFLKVTRQGLNRFMRKYPELIYGEESNPSVDLFQHGAHEGVWYGEDYAFSRRWNEIDDLWCVPDIDLHHHEKDKKYEGNFHQFLLAEKDK